jgi:hypothetical protein
MWVLASKSSPYYKKYLAHNNFSGIVPLQKRNEEDYMLQAL